MGFFYLISRTALPLAVKTKLSNSLQFHALGIIVF